MEGGEESVNFGYGVVLGETDADRATRRFEVEAFHQIRTPVKQLVVLPETSHMTLYSNLSRLEIASRAAASSVSLSRRSIARMPGAASLTMGIGSFGSLLVAANQHMVRVLK